MAKQINNQNDKTRARQRDIALGVGVAAAFLISNNLPIRQYYADNTRLDLLVYGLIFVPVYIFVLFLFGRFKKK